MRDYPHRAPEAPQDLAQWVHERRLTTLAHILECIESFPSAGKTTSAGENRGKLLIKT